MTDAEIRWLEMELELDDLIAGIDERTRVLHALVSAPPPPWYRAEWEGFVWSWRNRRWQLVSALASIALSLVALILSLLARHS